MKELKTMTIEGLKYINVEDVRRIAYETFKDRPLTTSDRFMELYDNDGVEVYDLNEAVAISTLIKQMVIGGENVGATCLDCSLSTLGIVSEMFCRDKSNNKQASPAYHRVVRTYQKHKRMGHSAVLVYWLTREEKK